MHNTILFRSNVREKEVTQSKYAYPVIYDTLLKAINSGVFRYLRVLKTYGVLYTPPPILGYSKFHCFYSTFIKLKAINSGDFRYPRVCLIHNTKTYGVLYAPPLILGYAQYK